METLTLKQRSMLSLCKELYYRPNNRLLAESVVDLVLDDDQPKTVPPPPPDLEKFRQFVKSDVFRNLPYKEKEQKAKYFYSRDDIEEYLDQKWEDEKYNRDTYLNLREFRNYLEDHDVVRIDKISKKIEEFKVVLETTDHAYLVFCRF